GDRRYWRGYRRLRFLRPAREFPDPQDTRAVVALFRRDPNWDCDFDSANTIRWSAAHPRHSPRSSRLPKSFGDKKPVARESARYGLARLHRDRTADTSRPRHCSPSRRSRALGQHPGSEKSARDRGTTARLSEPDKTLRVPSTTHAELR